VKAVFFCAGNEFFGRKIMRTVLDVKRALDPDIFVNMVCEKRKEEREAGVRAPRRDQSTDQDIDLFVNLLPRFQKEARSKKPSNVIPFPVPEKPTKKRKRKNG